MLVTFETVEHYVQFMPNNVIEEIWNGITDMPNAMDLTVPELMGILSNEMIVRAINDENDRTN